MFVIVTVLLALVVETTSLPKLRLEGLRPTGNRPVPLRFAVCGSRSLTRAKEYVIAVKRSGARPARVARPARRAGRSRVGVWVYGCVGVTARAFTPIHPYSHTAVL